MADTTGGGGGKERKGTSGGPARGSTPAKAPAAKTLGRRKAEARAAGQPAAKAAAKTSGNGDSKASAKVGSKPGKAEPTAGAKPGKSNGAQPDLLPGTDWDALAEKASDRIEETAQKAGAAARKAGEEAKKVAVDLSEGFDKAFAKVRTEAEHIMKKGKHTRARILFRGKQVGPEMPVAMLAAAEIASLWWAGPLRLILAHVVGKAVLDVEFVNDAQAHVTAGKAFISSGDIDEALREFDAALEMDRKSATAHLGRGICFKFRGNKAAARKEMVTAEELDPRGESGREARRHLDNLGT